MGLVDRTAIKKIRMNEEKSDYSYWRSQSYEARLNALESIREEFNKWKYHDQQRLQRVYRIIKL